MSRITKPRTKLSMLLTEEHFNRALRFWSWIYDAVDYAVDAWINRPRIGDTKPSNTVVTFKPRDHFKADGTAKVHRTQANAKEYCLENPGFHPYQCTVCQDWHVAHNTKRTRRLAS